PYSTLAANNDTVMSVLLYARWTPIRYTIGYSLAGGTNASGNPTGYTIESNFPIAVKDPSRLGFDFTGWNVRYSDGTTESAQIGYEVPDGTLGNITLTATWTVSIYTLTFYDDDRETVLDVQKVPYGQNGEQRVIPFHPGSVWLGWTLGWWNLTADRDLYAVYRPGGGTPGTVIPTTPYYPPYIPAVELIAPTVEPAIQTIPPVQTPMMPAPAPQTIVVAPPATPVAPPSGNWAVINLVLAVVGTIMAVVFIFMVFMKKGKGEYRPDGTEAGRDEQDEKKRRRSIILRAVNIVFGLFAVVLFLLTENMSLNMAWMDNWTIAHVIIFVAQIAIMVGAVLGRKKTNRPDVVNAAQEA
ncbi:MAG: InlB B-repeat-containing protein, partial [Eggerthellaceae bacterium]|nr:InlB B-repeat-containing protein [Eggerthellaceae bacterium]